MQSTMDQTSRRSSSDGARPSSEPHAHVPAVARAATWKRLRTMICISAGRASTSATEGSTVMRACYSTFLAVLSAVLSMPLFAAPSSAECLPPCVSNVAMENVLLVVSTDGVQMFIPTLTGSIVPRQVPAQLDADGILIRIDASEIRFSSAALAALIKHIFAARTELSDLAL